MVEYHVMLRRFKGSSRPDVCVFRDEDRKKAIREMARYVRENGFSVQDKDGRYTISTVTLLEKEPIAEAPVISELTWHELYEKGEIT